MEVLRTFEFEIMNGRRNRNGTIISDEALAKAFNVDCVYGVLGDDILNDSALYEMNPFQETFDARCIKFHDFQVSDGLVTATADILDTCGGRLLNKCIDQNIGFSMSPMYSSIAVPTDSKDESFSEFQTVDKLIEFQVFLSTCYKKGEPNDTVR